MNKKTILIIGSGGREHALGWKFAQSPHVGKIFFAPGNGGTENVGENVPIDITDNKALLAFAKERQIDLTFVGPEIPLCNGIVDDFQGERLKVFGPDKHGAQLEGSKAFASDFMERHGIPHPTSKTFAEAQEAIDYIKKKGATNCVIKASGLAAGKGVVLPESDEEVEQTIDVIMNKKIFGESGAEVVVQERISGPEVSIIAFTDGNTVVPLVPSQDHKRVFDHDKGPNTGGMGAYAPAPFVSAAQMEMIHSDILEKTIEGLKKDGITYRGILYAGLMMTQDGPKVLEYNVRFGDPETQPLMMLLDSDIYELSLACIEKKLTRDMVRSKTGASVCVVIAAPGYPESYETGLAIDHLDRDMTAELAVFHAGTNKSPQGETIVSGGRVLGVTAYGNDVKDARTIAYKAIRDAKNFFPAAHYRKDIGYQAL